MKLFIFFVLAAIALTAKAGLTDEQKTKLKAHYTECVEKTGVDKEAITKARKGEFADDEKLEKYYECMMYKMHFMCEDGTLHPEAMKAKLPASVDAVKGGQIIDKCCVKTEGATNHKTSFNIYKCFIETSGKEVKFW